MRNPLITVGILALLASVAPAQAQNMAGVFPPGFGPDHASAEYRVGYDPEGYATTQRIHYQRSFDERRLWRVIGQVRKTESTDVDIDVVSGELFWTLSQAQSTWQHGIRIDTTWRADDRPGSVSLNWSGQYVGFERLRLRANLLTAYQVGDNRGSGVFLQSRAELHFPLAGGRTAGLQHYGIYGSSADFRRGNAQTHQVGPYFTTPIGQSWRLLGSVLFGLTNGTQDTNLKFWIGRAF